jgi:hypothetical protein
MSRASRALFVCFLAASCGAEGPSGDDCVPTPVWYDRDGDGYGAALSRRSACDVPANAVENDDECDDYSSDVHPGVEEACNGIDDDCNGVADEDFDDDGDGYVTSACGGGDDCNDNDGAVHPGASDTCDDGVDNDCENGDALCGSFEGEVDLARAHAKVHSEGKNEELGRVVEVGDFDADGTPDVLAAAQYLHGVGGGYVLYGPFSGSHSALDVGSVLEAGSSDTWAGRSIAVGDLDGDGIDDVGIGAPYSEKVYVEFGPVTGSVELVDASLHASAPGEALFGHGFDIADTNGDAQDDLVIGSYEDSTLAVEAGAVFIVQGPLPAGAYRPAKEHDVALWGYEANQQAGRIVRVGGDFDGDGVHDTMLQAFGYSGGAPSGGAAFVVCGPIDGDRDLHDSDAILAGEAPDSWAGHSMSYGDINNDGVTDALVGAPFVDLALRDAGSGYVVLGPIEGVVDLADSDGIIRGTTEYEKAGNSMSAGDVDEDGFDDLLVGAPGIATAGTMSGAAYFYFGPLEGTVEGHDSDGVFMGEKQSDLAGAAVLLSDIDHHRGADLLVSAPNDATSGTGGGAVYVVYSAVQ